MQPAEQIRYMILATQREGNQALAQGLEPLAVTPSQAEVLRILADHGPQTLLGVGRLLVCEPGSPSRLVKTLADRRLVTCKRDRADRRSLVISLTAEGKRIAVEVQKVEARLHAMIDHLLPGGTGPELIALLRRLLGNGPHSAALQNRLKASPAQVQEPADRQ
jgi:MarR family transcriptional regulator, organic hydroperoxide resistance regulator